MSASKPVVIAIMMGLVALVAGPLLFDFALSLLEGLGYRSIRRNPVVKRLSRILARGSDSAEVLVMLSMLGMILLPIYLHFQEFAPFWKATHPHHDGVFHIVVHHILPSVFINSNLLLHFYKAAVVKPRAPQEVANNSMNDAAGAANPQHKRYCRVCKIVKPARAHHCSTCRRCVERLDHHCPFTMNCVGPGNHHHFYLFVTYGWIATVYAFYLSYHPYAECQHVFAMAPASQTISEGGATTTAASAQSTLALAAGSTNTVPHCTTWSAWQLRLFYASVASCVVLSSFWVFVTYLVITDQTTIEFLSFSKRKQQAELLAFYREKGVLNNLQSILGPIAYWWRLLLPLPFLHERIPPFTAPPSHSP